MRSTFQIQFHLGHKETRFYIFLMCGARKILFNLAGLKNLLRIIGQEKYLLIGLYSLFTELTHFRNF